MHRRVVIHCLMVFCLSLFAVSGCNVAPDVGQTDEVGRVEQAAGIVPVRYKCGCIGSEGAWWQYKTPTKGDIKSSCRSGKGYCNGRNTHYIWAYSVSNTNNATQNYHLINVDLNAGDQLLFGGCGTGAVFSGDTFIRLFNGESEVASNDDHCAYGSQIFYTAPTTGTYSAHLGCYSSGSCSGTFPFAVMANSDTIPFVHPGDWWSYKNTVGIPLNAGEQLRLSTCDAGGSGTAVLSLRDGLRVVANDATHNSGMCQAPGTGLVYTAPATGLYEADLGCYAADGCEADVVYSISGSASNSTTTDWVWCSAESGTCNTPGTKLVRFGIDSRWNYRIASNSVGCNNSQFGDPAYGDFKDCYYTNLPSETWTYCADEYQSCEYSGAVAIAYGTGTTWTYATGTSGSLFCDNSTFGDPAVGAMKYCYIKRL